MTSDLHQTLMATAAEPPFHAELEAVWGRPWGAHDEVGHVMDGIDGEDAEQEALPGRRRGDGDARHEAKDADQQVDGAERQADLLGG